VIVGIGGDDWSTTESVLGIRVPMATAIADAAAARRDYLDETGGRYVHLIADGDIQTSGDIAKALGCGADAVMLGEPLSLCDQAPAGGAWWHSAASHPSLPRGAFEVAGESLGEMERLLFGPADEPDGQLNLFGGLRRAMAKCGYRDLKEFQRVGLVLDR
jgi:IMP dehydrogenase